jgi:hypothetical protein
MKKINGIKELDEKSLNIFKNAFDNPISLQIFKTPMYDGDIEKCIERHKHEILSHIVYSKFCEMQYPVYNHKVYSMSGFLEQEGRLPNENDRIRIIKGKYYFEQGPDCIISEIGFYVVKGEGVKQ